MSDSALAKLKLSPLAFDLVYLALVAVLWLRVKPLLPPWLVGGGLLLGYLALAWVTRVASAQKIGAFNTPLLDQIAPNLPLKGLLQGLMSLFAIGHILMFPMLTVVLTMNLMIPGGIDSLDPGLGPRTVLGLLAVAVTILSAAWLGLPMTIDKPMEEAQRRRLERLLLPGLAALCALLVSRLTALYLEGGAAGPSSFGASASVLLYFYVPFRYWIERLSGASWFSALTLFLSFGAHLATLFAQTPR